MVIRTIFTCVIRFFRSIRAAFAAGSPSRPNTNDIESGVYESFGAADIEIGRISAGVEPDEPLSPSYYVFGRKPSRKISTVRPVKSRIVDAALRNVRDKRFSVLKEVVITRSSLLHLPCSVKVEVFPGPTPSSRASISSALRVLRTSGERVVKFVLTPTFLLDVDPLPQASRPARSGHSIEDIISLFPSPPAHISLEYAHSPKELDFGRSLVAQNSAKRSSGSSLSTSGSLSSVTSGTVATSPPTTPELAQMTQMINASSTTVELLSIKSQCRQVYHVESSRENVESASAVSVQTTLDQCLVFVPSCCTPVAVPHLSPWNNGYRRPDSAIALPFLQEGNTFSADSQEGLTYGVVEDCLSNDMTSKGQQAGNPETSLTIARADSELMPKDTFSMKHDLHAFRDANGEGLRGVLHQESCFSERVSRFTILQHLNTSTPSRSIVRDQIAPSSANDMRDGSSTPSEEHTLPNSIELPQHLDSRTPFSCAHGSSTNLAQAHIIIDGARKGQAYCNIIGNSSP